MTHGSRLVLLLCLAVACKDSSGPDEPSVTFAPIDAGLLAAVCWRANVIPPQSVGGAISSSDCDAADFDPADQGYFETYRIRVAATRTATVSTTSGFDTYLTVFRVNSITGSTADVTVIAEDDDSGEGLNAMVSVTFQPNVDYFVAVSGYDYTEVGSYQLVIN